MIVLRKGVFRIEAARATILVRRHAGAAVEARPYRSRHYLLMELLESAVLRWACGVMHQKPVDGRDEAIGTDRMSLFVGSNQTVGLRALLTLICVPGRGITRRGQILRSILRDLGTIELLCELGRAWATIT